MSTAKTTPTYEWYVEHYFENYQRLKQYRDQLNAKPPTLTLADLRDKARARALQAVQNDQLIASREIVDIQSDLESDAEYREERMDEYEKVGEWDDAGDKALLISLVELETQHRAIRRDLARATKLGEKERYWDALRQNSDAQKNLQITLGLDKKSREQARVAGNPMDNWKEIKDEVGDWVDMLVTEFLSEAKETKTEEDLRNLMKYKLSWSFEVVDSVVYNLKRVLGIVQEEHVEG